MGAELASFFFFFDDPAAAFAFLKPCFGFGLEEETFEAFAITAASAVDFVLVFLGVFFIFGAMLASRWLAALAPRRVRLG